MTQVVLAGGGPATGGQGIGGGDPGDQKRRHTSDGTAAVVSGHGVGQKREAPERAAE